MSHDSFFFSGGLSRFRLGIALNRLRKRGLVTEKTYSGLNEDWIGFCLSDLGEAWVETNQSRVGNLIREVEESREAARERRAQPARGDVPF